MTEVWLAAGRLLLATTFIWASVAKMRRWSDFSRATSELVPFGRFGASVAATLVPPVELAIAALLLAGAAVAPALLASTALLFSFLVVLARAYRLRLQSSCACFGGEGEPIGPVELVRTGVLFVLSLTGAALAFGGASADVLLSAAAVTVSALLLAIGLAGGAALRLLTVVEAEIRAGG